MWFFIPFLSLSLYLINLVADSDVRIQVQGILGGSGPRNHWKERGEVRQKRKGSEWTVHSGTVNNSSIDPFRHMCLCVCVCVCVLSHAQLFATPCSSPGPSVHEILQARILEWVANYYSRGSSWPRDRTHISCVSCIGRQILYHLRPLGIPRTCAWNLPNPRGEGAEEFLLQLSGGDETYPQALLTCWKKVLGSNKSDNTMLRPEGHWDNPKIPSIGPMPKLRDYALCTCVFGVFLSKAEWPLMMCTWDLSLAAVPYPLPVGHSTHMGLEQWLDLASPPHHIFLSFVSKFFK